MKKIFGLFIFIFMFLNLFTFVPKTNINLFKFSKNNNNIVMHEGEIYTEVRDAQGFIDAANNNENIMIMNDISFEEIDSTTTIDSYSGIIDGQYYTLSNHNYKKEYTNETFAYLFDSFNGTIKNITFVQFPFFINEAIGDRNNSTYEFENITFNNVTVEDIVYESNVESTEAMFIATGTDLDIKNVSFNNINFINNTLYKYISSGSAIYFGFFAGEFISCNLSEIYLLNLNISNNIIDSHYTDSSQSSITTSSESWIGIFMARSVDTNLNDIIINGLIFNDNFVASQLLHFGIFIGDFSIEQGSVLMERVYSANVTMNNNTIISDLDFNNSLMVSSFIGNTSYLTSNTDAITYNSIVVSEFNGDSTSNIFKFSDESKNDNGKFAEIIGDNLVTSYYNEVFYVNEEGLGNSTDYSYTTHDSLTTDFWTNTANFGNSNIWNLDILYNQHLNISSDENTNSEIYGYPLFNTFNYLNITFTDSNMKEDSTYIMNIDYVPSESATSAHIYSIFGDDYELSVDVLNSHKFNTEIPVSVPIEKIYDYYWVDLQKNNNEDTNIIIGSVLSTNSKTLYTEEPNITNNGSLIFSYGDEVNQLTFESDSTYSQSAIDEYDVSITDPENISVKVKDVDGNEYILDNENPSIDLPSYIDFVNINYYYQIDNDSIYSGFWYLGTDKTLKQVPFTWSQNTDLTNTDPNQLQSLQPPKFNLTSTSTFSSDDIISGNDNYIDFSFYFTGDFNLVLNQDDIRPPEDALFIVTSAFNEFEENGTFTNTKEIWLDDFTPSDNNQTIDYRLYLKSDVPKDIINDYYSISLNTTYQVEYYSDLSGNTSNSNLLDIDEENSVLTNENNVEPYDETQEFIGLIETTYNSSNNTLSFTINDQNDYQYEVLYEINLILRSSNESQEFVLTNEQPSVSIELNDSLTYNLENSPEYTINDYYSISLNDDSPSIIEYVASDGSFNTETFTSLSIDNSQVKGINQELVLRGDLTNVSLINDPNIEGDDQLVSLVDNNGSTDTEDKDSIWLSSKAIMIYVLILFIALIIWYYVRTTINAKHDYKF